ncbi:SusE domain-containing protein, partial [Balneolaceae bacterium ANBcel3]|nr:SusE domain-containing protein [Balneolaceae bacterium ANBcel3]
GIAAGVACASTPIGWGTCAAIAVGSGALTLSGFSGLFNRHDDLNNDDCNMPEGPDNFDPETCGSCGGDGGGFGDPHLFTFDGLNYSFQAAGEFILTRSKSDDFEVQARMEQMEPDRDRFTIFTAFALNVHGDEIVILEDDAPPYIPSLKINGNLQNLDEMGMEPVQLPAGGTIRWIGNTFIIHWPESNTVVHAWQSPAGLVTGNRALAIEIVLDEKYRGQLEGLLGSFDPELRNAMTARDGRTFFRPLSYEELYDEFGNSWRIHQRESLFGTKTFKVPNIPANIFTTNDLDPSTRQEAQTVCENRGISNPILLDNCIFDVALSGDHRFAYDAASLITSASDEQMSDFLADDEGKIQIDLLASGTASSSFEFQSDNPDIGSFSLSENDQGQHSNTRVFHPLNPGTYHINLASAMNDYELLDIVCENGDAEVDLEEKLATIYLEGGESIRCSFSIIPENVLRHFVLQTPEDESQVEVAGMNDDEFTFSWESAALTGQDPVTYFLVLDTDEHFRNPFFQETSNHEGTETSKTLTYEQMDQFLEEQQVDPGASFNGYWTVKAEHEGVVRRAAQAHRIVFTRGTVAGTSPQDLQTPDEFVLKQNYPNPFNPSTIITYKLPESSQVTLSVYNILGQHITTLVDTRQAAGTHRVQFDAGGLSSGTYIYRIEAGRFMESGTMMFIK